MEHKSWQFYPLIREHVTSFLDSVFYFQFQPSCTVSPLGSSGMVGDIRIVLPSTGLVGLMQTSALFCLSAVMGNSTMPHVCQVSALPLNHACSPKSQLFTKLPGDGKHVVNELLVRQCMVSSKDPRYWP